MASDSASGVAKARSLLAGLNSAASGLGKVSKASDPSTQLAQSSVRFLISPDTKSIKFVSNKDEANEDLKNVQAAKIQKGLLELANALSALEMETKNVEETLEKETKAKSEVSKKLQACENERKTFLSGKKIYLQDIERLTNKVIELNESIKLVESAAEEARVKSRQEVDGMNEALKSYFAEKAALISKLNAKSEMIAKLEDQCAAANDALSKAKQETNALKKKTSSLVDDHASLLETEKSKNNSAMEALRLEISTLNTIKRKTALDFEALREALTKLDAEKAEAIKRIGNEREVNEKEMKVLKKELQGFTKRLQGLEEVKKAMERTVTDLSNEKAKEQKSAEEKYYNLFKEVQDAKHEKEELQNKLKALQGLKPRADMVPLLEAEKARLTNQLEEIKNLSILSLIYRKFNSKL